MTDALNTQSSPPKTGFVDKIKDKGTYLGVGTIGGAVFAIAFLAIADAFGAKAFGKIPAFKGKQVVLDVVVGAAGFATGFAGGAGAVAVYNKVFGKKPDGGSKDPTVQNDPKDVKQKTAEENGEGAKPQKTVESVDDEPENRKPVKAGDQQPSPVGPASAETVKETKKKLGNK